MFYCFVLIYASSFMTIKEKVDALNKALINMHSIEHLLILKNKEFSECSKRANFFTDEIRKNDNKIATLKSELNIIKMQYQYINKEPSMLIKITHKEGSLKLAEDKKIFLSGQLDNVYMISPIISRNLSELNQKKENCDAEIKRIKSAPIREAD